MSGPDLPRVSPDSNEIGLFQIGSSQIGDIPQFDVWQTVISQYANSPIITTILLNLAQYLDQTQNLENFFDQVRNLDTAIGWGLDVWGRILAVNRVLSIGIGPEYFGFDEGLPDYDSFGTGGKSPFYSGEKLTENYLLTDDGFRVLLIAKAFSNICDGSIGSINRLLVMLFGSSGRCYVVDSGGMAMVYKFEFPLSALQYAILVQSGVMPRPTGVQATVEQF